MSLPPAVLHRGFLMLCQLVLFAGMALFLFNFVPIVLVGILFVAIVARNQWRGAGYAHGTSRFATLEDLLFGGVLGSSGILLARCDGMPAPPFWRLVLYTWTLPFHSSDALMVLWNAQWKPKNSRWIRLTQFVHLVTFAPAGRGKGTCVIIPNLLSYQDSIVVFDPKGENYLHTAEWRRKVFGHHVVVLDPFGLVKKTSDRYNPLAGCSPDSPHVIDDARAIANALIIRTGQEREPHWNDSSELILTALIAVVICSCPPAERHLQTVRELTTDATAFLGAIAVMEQSSACEGMLRRLGHQLRHFRDRELDSVRTTLHRHLAWCDSPAMVSSTKVSSFEPGQLRSGKLSLYIILPADKIRSHAGWTRMVITGLLRSLIHLGPQERYKTLFLLDEAGHLGHVQALEDGLTLLRGYGIRLWFFYQAIAQVSDCFPGDGLQKFLSNTDTQQFFGLNDLQSAELVASRLGTATITTESFQSSQSYSYSEGYGHSQTQPGQISNSSSTTYSEMARNLLKPEEVLQLPGDKTVIFTKGFAPILATLVPYFSKTFTLDSDVIELDSEAASHRPFNLANELWAVVIFIGLWLAQYWVRQAYFPPRPGDAAMQQVHFLAEPPLEPQPMPKKVRKR